MNARMTTGAALLSLLIGGPAVAAPITDICLKGGRGDARCQCATDQLALIFSEDDFVLYSAVADAYLLRADTGMSDARAWDGAHAEIAKEFGLAEANVSARSKMAAVLHRDAMRQCR